MIKVYKKGDLKSGFEGVRVAVSIAGKVHAKYYSVKSYTHTAAMELATAQEKVFLAKQLKAKCNKIKSKQTNTGLIGLSLQVDVRKFDNASYSYRRIVFQNKKKQEKPFVQSWLVPKEGISDDLWFEICRTISNTRAMLNKTFDKLLGMRPSVEKIEKVFSQLES